MASIISLRRNALQARRRLTPEARELASGEICRRVCESREFFASHNVACFLPMRDEVDTREIFAGAWRANKRTFVPVLRGRAEMVFCEIDAETRLERNRFDIWEPVRGVLVDPRQLDIVITPTVAFDDNHNRIGMGSAYYDRCFAFLRHRQYWLKPKLIGVAFRCQRVEKITPNPWDIPLYTVVTEQD
ncbi:MAG: 5-formyltetrahydrofolate cyclo-ligase [Woeseiaceae bacterium]|jgi:5-formyltetrahydrofolate cyclo-ligase